MSKYRINVRFDTDDPKQAEAVKFLQSLEHSRNAFIVSAVLDAISEKSATNNISLENIRKVIQEELRTLGIIQSLSGTGHCFDNARMESFFATLKKEKIYQIAAYKLTRAQVKTIIFRYVFTYYNRIRICSVNPGGLPPVKYREWVAAHAA